MKKLALILAIIIALCCTGLACAEAATPAAHISGDYKYILLEDGTAEITAYGGSAAEIIVPAELDGHRVSAMGDYGFMFALSLRSITIPEGVERIGTGAFSMCYYLSDIVFPDGLISIGENVFWDCASLYRVAIPASVTDIHDNAFSNCPDLTLIAAPGSFAEQYAKDKGFPCEIIEPAA